MNKEIIEIIAVVLSIISTVLFVLGYLFLPRFRNFIWQTLEEDEVKYDALRVASFSRQISAGKEVVRTMLAKELEELEVSKALTEEHADRLKFIDAVLLEQGKEIRQLPIIANAMLSSANSIGEIAKSMKEIHREVTDHGKRLERWDGFFEGKEAGERRRIIRRNEDKEE